MRIIGDESRTDIGVRIMLNRSEASPDWLDPKAVCMDGAMGNDAHPLIGHVTPSSLKTPQSL